MSFVGGCLCGGVRFSVERRFLNAACCYCQMCRKAHGSAYSVHVMVKSDQLSWLKGRARLVRYESSPGGFREFCEMCGTHVLVHGQSGDGVLAIPAGTLDGDPELTIKLHMFTDDRVVWTDLDSAAPSYPAWPPGYGPES